MRLLVTPYNNGVIRLSKSGKNEMKFLIAGLGSIGRRHLHNLLTLGEQDIILYRTHQSTLPDVDLPDFPVETTLQAAFSHKPDAVIVSNPTALHLEVAIPAAQAGCHILLEKPVSHNLDQVDTLVKLVQKTGSRILVGYHFRFHPGLIKGKPTYPERCYRSSIKHQSPLGRISTWLASLGRLPSRLQCPFRSRRRRHPDLIAPSGLS